jgi:glycosyltransferase involved in cell wall biosynthesis
MSAPQISVVIPCLNEAKTIASVIAEALEGIRLAGLVGEVVVADNGSTDGSQEISIASGARVVPVPIRGYGAALHYGIMAARGEWVIFGDADMSYDFRLLPRFVQKIPSSPADGPDLILGSRLMGDILPGAMPFLNRYLGTPALNMAIFLFFGLRTSDCNSGMRMFRRSFYERLPMRAPGMEWASEFLIKSKIFGAKYQEVPIVLRPDQRGRAPHLRRWRDGWRHLKTIVLLSPNRLIFLPSLFIAMLAILSLFSAHISWVPSLCSIAVSGVFLWLLVKLILHADGVRESRVIRYLLQSPTAEYFLGIGLVCTFLGGVGTIFASSFSSAWALSLSLVSAGTLMLLSSFAWGSIITHFVRTLDSAKSKV